MLSIRARQLMQQILADLGKDSCASGLKGACESDACRVLTSKSPFFQGVTIRVAIADFVQEQGFDNQGSNTIGICSESLPLTWALV